MGIVSYAQNREDVRLARVLTGPTGFYIDIGAADPTVHSITRHFADRGWHGVNVEPRADAADALRRARPRDTTIEALVGRADGDATFFELSQPELGEVSTSRPDRAAAMAESGYALTERRVPMWTLARLCEAHAAATIDFLSIDVEGAEADVIDGGDWQRFRPRIIVIEALNPVTRVASHDVWEPQLLDAGYVFVVEDGINRFYVTREEAAALAPVLAQPVSWLDRYEPHEYLREIERIRAESRAASAADAPTAAARLLDDAATQQAATMWAAYDGLRDELTRLRQRLEYHERQVAGGAVTVQAASGPITAASIGPVWLALAARGTRLSRRYPVLGTRVKTLLLGVYQRLRRRA